tara:strand:- start:253 stop:867 length:615 start_codon:yes stop_codon:yes gene_type:complete
MALISNGTTIFDAGSMAAGLGSSLALIKKLTASSSSTLSFVNGANGVVLDNTYKEYLFIFNLLHPSAAANFTFQGSINTGGAYGVAITSSHFQNKMDEGNTGSHALTYEAGRDLAQSTSVQRLTETQYTDNDMSCSGYLHLFNPSSTTFVKNFYSTFESITDNPSSSMNFCGGYFNTTSAIDAVQFKFESGNIDTGSVTLYGIA